MRFLPQPTWQSSNNFFSLTKTHSSPTFLLFTLLSHLLDLSIPYQCSFPKYPWVLFYCHSASHQSQKEVMWILSLLHGFRPLFAEGKLLFDISLFSAFLLFLLPIAFSHWISPFLSKAVKVPFFAQSNSFTLLLAIFLYIFNTSEFHFSPVTTLLANPLSNFGRLTEVQWLWLMFACC